MSLKYLQFQTVDISTKDPCTLVLLLDSPEILITCKACEALKKYVEICKFDYLKWWSYDTTFLSQLNQTAVKWWSSARYPDSLSCCHQQKELLDLTLCCVLHQWLLTVRQEKGGDSTRILNTCCIHYTEAVRLALYSLDCIKPLLILLGPEEELVTQERASFTLSQIASKSKIRYLHYEMKISLLLVEYSFKVYLEKHSAHSPLLNLLQSTDPDVQVILLYLHHIALLSVHVLYSRETQSRHFPLWWSTIRVDLGS